MPKDPFPEKPGHLLLKFRIREAPEGWWLFFETLQWGPFLSRKAAMDLACEMQTTLAQQFNMPIDERKTVERRDKELMPWAKPKGKRGKR